MTVAMLFILFLAAAAQATFFQPSKSNIQRCFDLTGDDPNFFDCLQSLVCSAPVPTMSSYNTTVTPSPASSSPSVTPTPCVPCDCSQYDKNSEEYFQCVTDPACDRCTATTSWTNTSAPITSPPSTSSSIDYETMKPGTYTFVANGTTRVMVVPTTANATAQIVTVTLTTVLTVPFSESAAVSAQTASLTTTMQSACPSYCDCSKIKDKTSDEYFQCLTNPNCEHCHVTVTTSSTTKTSSSAAAKSTNGPDCPDSCECDKIKDKQSDKYFQCITDDACKHCFRKRWFGRFWARG